MQKAVIHVSVIVVLLQLGESRVVRLDDRTDFPRHERSATCLPCLRHSLSGLSFEPDITEASRMSFGELITWTVKTVI